MPYFNFLPAASGEQCTKSTVTGALATGAIFTVANGPILVVGIHAVCTTANGAAATTLQFRSSPTVGTATTFSGASASLISVAAGTIVNLNKTALSTAPDIVLQSAGGLPLGTNVANYIVIQAGTIDAVVTNATTGAWSFYIRWMPYAPTVTVV